MIELYQGRIGGGKTYAAVRRVIKSLAAGRTCYTNIEFDLEGVKVCLAKRFSVEVEPEQLKEWPDERWKWHEIIRWGTPQCPVMVVIDEAQLHYNSRDWAETQKMGKAMLSFLTQSRKSFVDVIFITQEVGNIDKQFRVLCQFIWSFRDLQHAGIPIVGGLFGRSFFFSKKDYGGALIDKGMIPKEKDYFEAYNTYAFLDPKMAEKAEREMERAIAQRQPRKLTVKERLAIIREAKEAKKQEAIRQAKILSGDLETCPGCEGTGIDDYDHRCSQCQGRGVLL